MVKVVVVVAGGWWSHVHGVSVVTIVDNLVWDGLLGFIVHDFDLHLGVISIAGANVEVSGRAWLCGWLQEGSECWNLGLVECSRDLQSARQVGDRHVSLVGVNSNRVG